MKILSRRILQWSLRIGISIALLVVLSRHFLPRLFTNDPRVLRMSPSKSNKFVCVCMLRIYE